MKLCERCGDEIDTKDGENRCSKCDGRRGSKKSKTQRQMVHDVMTSLGLVKVKGALGGTYYE